MIDCALYHKQGTYAVGDHFGEESCILDAPSEETVVADSFCKCVQLYGPDLTQVMDSFQEATSCPGDVPEASPPGTCCIEAVMSACFRDLRLSCIVLLHRATEVAFSMCWR